MGRYAKDVLAQAQAWIGRKESDGSHKEIINVYNAHKPLARGYAVKFTDPWCATFISALAIKCGCTDIIPTECSCSKMIELLKQIGSFVEDDAYIPKTADLVFYDWDDNGVGDNRGSADHIGIVEKIEGNTITVIEGNYNNCVGRRTLKVNAKYIRGYGVPKYDAEPVGKSIDDLARDVINGKYGNGEARKKALGDKYAEVQKRVNEILAGKTAKKSVDVIAKEVIQGKWGNGADRKKRLTDAGYNYTEVQNKVNQLLK